MEKQSLNAPNNWSETPKMEKMSLKDIWDDAEDRFQKLTGKVLRVNPPKTLDSVRKEIEALQARMPSDDTDLKTRAKETCMNVLNCIKLLGGVAAQGAAIVFGPADLCFNAASLLFDIPQKMHEFHEAVDGLFEQVSVFLVQFKIYQRIDQFSSIDPDLNDTIHRLMISFVHICALSIKLRKGNTWIRAKSAMKRVLCDDDSGVKKELDGFKALIDKQSVIGATLTLEYVLESRRDLVQLLSTANDTGKRIADIATSVNVLTAAENSRKLEQITKDQQAKIAKKLFVMIESAQASKTTCNEYWIRSVNKTGAWLRDFDTYKSWFDVKSDASPLLLLTGDTNSGKSFLVSAIIHHLQSEFGQETKGAARSLIVYHFFPKWTEKMGRDGRDDKPVETALKCIALQIAELDTAYAKTIATFCDSIKDDSYFKELPCKDLWRDLKLSGPNPNLVYFLLLDGLDQLPKDSAAKLLDILGELHQSPTSSDGSHIRLLATGKADTFHQDIFLNAPTIDVNQRNDSAIEAYIDRELGKLDLLQGQDSDTVKMRRSFLDELPEVAQGNFFKVQTAIEKISEVVESDGTFAELEKILKEAGQDRETIAQNVISELTEQLKAKEIEELNELLVWVVFGSEYFDVDQLQAALYLRFKTTSLQSLEKKLMGKYAKIFEVDGRGVSIIEDIEDIVKTSKSTRGTVGTPKITATITITQADISAVQSFLWKLTEKGLRDNFEFNESAAPTKIKGTIRVNAYDAHLAIVQQALTLLLANPDEKSKALTPYLFEYLPVHLDFLTNAKGSDEIGPADKREIGSGLFTLLADGDIFERHWDSCKGCLPSWISWGRVWIFWKWLDDMDAISGLSKKDKAWLDQLKKEGNPNRSIMRPATIMVASHWLQARDWLVEDTFNWIRQFLALDLINDSIFDKDSVYGSDKDEVVNDNDNASFVGLNIGEANAIAKAAEWAQKVLQIKELNSLWYERLGLTYSKFSEFDSAVTAFKEAIKLDDSSWRSFEGLACALFAKADQVSSAASEMEKALEILRRIEYPSEIERESLIDNLKRLAGWRTKLREPESAIKLFEEVLAMDPHNYEAHYGVLKTILTSGYEERARDLLNDMSAKSAADSDLTQLTATLQQLIKDDYSEVIFGIMFSTTRKTEVFSVLLENIQQAIDFARREKRTRDLSVLLLHKGIAIHHYDERQERNPELALNLWEECGSLVSKENPWEFFHSQLLATRFISLYYFHQARSSENPTTHVQKMEEYAANRRGFGFTDPHARSYLGCYYALMGDTVKAKQLFLNDIKSAMDLLTDDIDENDWQGYYYLADVLMHSGDYLNALSAWSLIGPTDFDYETMLLSFEDESSQSMAENLISAVHSQCSPEALLSERVQLLIKEAEAQASKVKAEDEAEIPRAEAWQRIQELLTDCQTRIEEGDVDNEPRCVFQKDRPGYLGNQCDGRCGTVWRYANDFYCCKFCPDVQFCKDCLDLLSAGNLKRYICSAKHEFLHVPKWDDAEYSKIGKRKVKVRGELRDGIRVGGDVVTVEEWLDGLREDWEIPKPEKRRMEDQDALDEKIPDTD